jgi:hypothetical protein
LRTLAVYAVLTVGCVSFRPHAEPMVQDAAPAASSPKNDAGAAFGPADTPTSLDAANPSLLDAASGISRLDVFPSDPSPPPVDVPSAPGMVSDALTADAGADAAGSPNASLNIGLLSRWKLDEGMGNVAVDSAGAGNNGTLQGPAWVTVGFPGARYPNPAALRFDGNDDFVSLGTRNLPANDRPQSVAFWFNVQAFPTTTQVCLSLTDGEAGGMRLKIGFQNSHFSVWKSSSDELVGAPAVAPGWHHYAYTFAGATHRLYVDGSLRSQSTVPPDYGSVTNARIGAIFNNAENFLGLIDEVRIYDRPLDAAEVSALSQGYE